MIFSKNEKKCQVKLLASQFIFLAFFFFEAKILRKKNGNISGKKICSEKRNIFFKGFRGDRGFSQIRWLILNPLTIDK